MSSTRPNNIGIKAIEIYFPNQVGVFKSSNEILRILVPKILTLLGIKCVEQQELEKFDGVSEGKYTIGLGQTKMSFCDDREDIYSFALTVCSNLLRKYNIDVNSIGRLEVGTETLLDKSKSVKSVLMQLFNENTNIEGADTVNACYGGTNAVFNAVNWIESSAWDGRDAIVVAGDIALYAKGNARPTGGAGAVALLIGPNAPILVEPGLRGSYMKHAYDFYKPDLTSEYPIVDGIFSVRCYTEALDACYKTYNKRESILKPLTNGHTNCHTDNSFSKLPLDRFDYMIFHAPTCKLVAKSYARLLYNDFLSNPHAEMFSEIPSEIKNMEYTASLTDRIIEKTFMGLSKKRFNERVFPSIEVPTMCGNMYTASVYSGLVSLLSNVDSDTLQGKRIGVFSYGSGLASSFFSCKVVSSTENLKKILNVKERLAARHTLSPVAYDQMCELRKKAHLQKNYTPSGSVETIGQEVYYLSSVDEMFRRKYEIKL